MPRNGPTRGYDTAHVCAFCIELLNSMYNHLKFNATDCVLIHVWNAVTALSKSQLRMLPISKLRHYVDGYNISIKGAVDKNDIVDVMIAARVCPSSFYTIHLHIQCYI